MKYGSLYTPNSWIEFLYSAFVSFSDYAHSFLFDYNDYVFMLFVLRWNDTFFSLYEVYIPRKEEINNPETNDLRKLTLNTLQQTTNQWLKCHQLICLTSDDILPRCNKCYQLRNLFLRICLSSACHTDGNYVSLTC